jgi:hypothetical protein
MERFFSSLLGFFRAFLGFLSAQHLAQQVDWHARLSCYGIVRADSIDGPRRAALIFHENAFTYATLLQ